jgi:hypothetical protein
MQCNAIFHVFGEQPTKWFHAGAGPGKPRARPAFARVLASYAGAHVTAPLALRAANGNEDAAAALMFGGLDG